MSAWDVPPPLRGLVASGVGYTTEEPPGSTHRGLPSRWLTVILTWGRPLRMLAHPDAAQAPGSFDVLVGGLHDTPALIDMSGAQEGIQLSLTPLGARRLLGLPAGELARLDCHGSDLFPDAGELLERLAAAPDWPGRWGALERFLLVRLRDGEVHGGVREAWRLLQESGGRLPVAALADRVGYSPRRLGQLFSVDIGLSPKESSRVARFQASRRLVVARARAGQPLDLGDAAAVCGFADQGHLAREWAAIAGAPPTRWLAEEQFRSVQAADPVAV